MTANPYDVSPFDESVAAANPAAEDNQALTPYAVDAADDPDTGELDLEDRQALRRVAGFSTELADISEVEYRQLRLERVVLVGVWTEGTAADTENSMTELRLLAQTAGSDVCEGFVQRRNRPDTATYIGSGKVAELREAVAALGADTVICDGELSPAQLRNLEDKLKVKVIDRTALILDIFAQHAKSKEGKAQVELAQLSYFLPRLRGWGGNLSRQAGGRAGGGNGGVGLRGPGETKLEMDRRRIRTRMAKLRKDIAGMGAQRETKRHRRQHNAVPSVAIAGYTNAGKSSLLNRLTGAGVLVEDALFATLDATTRRASTPEGRLFTLTDTVGFVRHLPHELIEAFRSTLEEVAAADVVVHVVDGAHPDPEGQINAVRKVLAESGAAELPEIIAINKADLADPLTVAELERREPGAVVVSARTGAGIDRLVDAIATALPRPDLEVDALVPWSRSDLVARVHEHGEVLEQEHLEDGTRLRAKIDAALAAELDAYVTSRR